MKKPKLKPCPFCGSKNISIHIWEIMESFFIMCKDCPARMEDMIEGKDGINKPTNLKDAIKYWNRRSK